MNMFIISFNFHHEWKLNRLFYQMYEHSKTLIFFFCLLKVDNCRDACYIGINV